MARLAGRWRLRSSAAHDTRVWFSLLTRTRHAEITVDWRDKRHAGQRTFGEEQDGPRHQVLAQRVTRSLRASGQRSTAAEKAGTGVNRQNVGVRGNDVLSRYDVGMDATG